MVSLGEYEAVKFGSVLTRLRYPGQEHVTGNTKIPSLLYYDYAGNVVAAGAEAEGGQIADQAEDEGWTKVELCVSVLCDPLPYSLNMLQVQITITTEAHGARHEWDAPESFTSRQVL